MQPVYFCGLCSDVSKVIVNNLHPSKIEKKHTNKGGSSENSGLPQSIDLIINSAHEKLQTAFSLGVFARLNRSLRSLIIDDLLEIKKNVLTTLNSVYDTKRGASYVKKCIDKGYYLSLLKVYFLANPNTLKNKSDNEGHDDGFNSNVIHAAVASKYHKNSSSFISFVLQMNQEHFASKSTKENNLDLLAQRDCYKYMPIHQICSYDEYNDEGMVKHTLTQLFSLPNGKLQINALAPMDPIGFYEENEGEMVPPLYFLESKENVEFLLKNGALANLQNEKGNTVLHLWAKEAKYELIQTLVEQGADLNIQNIYGETPLDLALATAFDSSLYRTVSEDDKFNTIKILLDNGAQKNHIDTATTTYSPEIMKLLTSSSFEAKCD